MNYPAFFQILCIATCKKTASTMPMINKYTRCRNLSICTQWKKCSNRANRTFKTLICWLFPPNHFISIAVVCIYTFFRCHSHFSHTRNVTTPCVFSYCIALYALTLVELESLPERGKFIVDDSKREKNIGQRNKLPPVA